MHLLFKFVWISIVLLLILLVDPVRLLYAELHHASKIQYLSKFYISADLTSDPTSQLGSYQYFKCLEIIWLSLNNTLTLFARYRV